MPKYRFKLTVVVITFTLFVALSGFAPVEAQRLRFVTPAPASPTTTYVPLQSPAYSYTSLTANQPVLLAQQPLVTLQNPQPLGAPTFDPYAGGGGTVTAAPLGQPFAQPYAQPGVQAYAQPVVQPAPTPGYGWSGGPGLPSVTGQYQFLQPNGAFATVPRFLQQVRVRHGWVKGSGGSPTKLGINSTEVDGTFLFPLFYLKDPFLLTPGFAVHFLEGPAGSDPAPTLPSRLHDAYVDLGWQPVISQWMKADLALRIGMYSDFEKWDSRGVRVLGKGYAVWSHSATMEFKAGVLYLDRLGTKLLPAGGFVWMPGGPNGDMRWEVLFPNPKLSQRLTYFGTWDVWWYVAGEYGGGTWAYQRGAGLSNDQVEYKDYRLITGLEWTTVRGTKGFVEAGWVFARELDYRKSAGVDLSDSFMLRAGVIF